MSETHSTPSVEYMVSRVGGTLLFNADPISQWLNDRAAEGWRLISVSDGVCYFERGPAAAAVVAARGRQHK